MWILCCIGSLLLALVNYEFAVGRTGRDCKAWIEAEESPESFWTFQVFDVFIVFLKIVHRYFFPIMKASVATLSPMVSSWGTKRGSPRY
jgi:hypothetical protein